MNGQPHGQTQPGAGAPIGSGGIGPNRIGIVRNPRSHRNKGETVTTHEDARAITAVPRNRDDLAGVLGGFARE